VLCGHHPYVEIQSDFLVVKAIVDKVRPKRLEEAKHWGFSNELWRTVELCWLEDRRARPRVEGILSSLRVAAAQGIERLQQRGKILPRVSAFFQLLQDPERKVERLVSKMDNVGPSPLLP
jgi:hypothetical protein